MLIFVISCAESRTKRHNSLENQSESIGNVYQRKLHFHCCQLNYSPSIPLNCFYYIPKVHVLLIRKECNYKTGGADCFPPSIARSDNLPNATQAKKAVLHTVYFMPFLCCVSQRKQIIITTTLCFKLRVIVSASSIQILRVPKHRDQYDNILVPCRIHYFLSFIELEWLKMAIIAAKAIK